jgi:hypothetical protein
VRAPIILAAILLGAWAAQILRPDTALMLPGAPGNWIIVLVPVSLALLAGFLRPDLPLVRQAGSAPLAIAALLAIAATCWPIATHPVGLGAPSWLHRIGLGDPLSSLPFAVALGAVLVSLATSLGRRVRQGPQRWRFALLHTGLLLSITAAAAGHGGLVRARFSLEEHGSSRDRAETESGQPVRLPVGISLEDFILERFSPMLLVAGADGSVRRGQTLLGPEATDTVGGLRIRVLEWLPAAAVPATTPIAFIDPAANPAARIAVQDATGNDLGSGWVHPASPVGAALFLGLPGGGSVHLEAPRPRRFRALVHADDVSHEITVNRPLRIAGWVVYLLSYDEAAGPASRTAVFEAVEDRALPLVYLGLALVACGMAWHLWRPVRPEVVA